MSTVVVDKVGTSNIRVTLSDKDAEQTLRHVLSVGRPDVLGVQEWDGPTPDLDLQRRMGVGNDATLAKVAAQVHRDTGATYRFARPKGGGSPVVWDDEKLDLLHITNRVIAPAQAMGFIPGRRTKLGPSVVTIAVFRDRRTQARKVVVNFHLTAEVQVGKGYRADRLHRPRVRRHQRERLALQALAVTLATDVHVGGVPETRVYEVGDGNFDGMKVAPLVACWVGHPQKEADGTLGKRTVDYVYGPDRAESVDVVVTRSDHDSVIATYRYRV